MIDGRHELVRLAEALSQVETLTEHRPGLAVVDRG